MGKKGKLFLNGQGEVNLESRHFVTIVVKTGWSKNHQLMLDLRRKV